MSLTHTWLAPLSLRSLMRLVNTGRLWLGVRGAGVSCRAGAPTTAPAAPRTSKKRSRPTLTPAAPQLGLQQLKKFPTPQARLEPALLQDQLRNQIRVNRLPLPPLPLGVVVFWRLISRRRHTELTVTPKRSPGSPQSLHGLRPTMLFFKALHILDAGPLTAVSCKPVPAPNRCWASAGPFQRPHSPL